MKKPAISLHQDELDSLEVEIIPIKVLEEWRNTAHRDDHYMFIVQRDGDFSLELDFSQVRLTGPGVCFVAPGQVHRYIDFKSSTGWMVFAGTKHVASQVREIFDTFLNVHQIAAIKNEGAVLKLVPVLQDLIQEQALPLKEQFINSLMETFTGLVASHILESQDSTSLNSGRKYHLISGFKQLVAKNYKAVKQVQAYAELLHITPLYLNEVTREITGFSASYWIHQEILLEAKRMLYYTVLDVKQIAYELGYEDHTYFSRFFKKHTGLTALDFRNSKPLIVQS